LRHGVYVLYQPRRQQNIVQKVLLASGKRRRCSNKAQTRNPLEFVGVPQTNEPISAARGLKFAILWGHVDMPFNEFFYDCRHMP